MPQLHFRIGRRSQPLVWLLTMLMLTSCGTFRKANDADDAGGWGGRSGERGGTNADALSTEEMGVHKAEIYEAMARASRAQASQDVVAMERALDEAMEHVRVLVRRDATMEDAELRELYRSVITTYEGYYGVSDSLVVEYGDIFALREEMFAGLNDLEDPLLEDVMLPDIRRITGTIPLARNRLVEQSIQYLLKNPEKHLYRWMNRSFTYFPMIEQILAEEGVPDELKYLAMVESGLNPRARSRVGAGGMWQFMPATGRAYGLRTTHWIDERSDPEKATRAAARYLRDLHNQFDDWLLAIAAYNCGPGRVRSAVRRHGGNATFWDVYRELPRETRNYVPMFTAAALVAPNPDAFGLNAADPGPRYAYDVVEVQGQLSLQQAADLAGTDVATLKALNPEILQWTTPPSSTAYQLRVPEGTGDRFAGNFTALPDDQKRNHATYTVKRGDTLGRIARRYGTTVSALQQSNGLTGTLIREGQSLYVPVRYDSYTGADVDGRGRVSYDAPPVRYASTNSGPPPAVAAVTTSGSNTRVRYEVRRGDNLSKIASRYNVSVGDIKRWNGLTSDVIRTGQTLTLHAASGTSSGGATVYRVRRGDSLSKIAARHGVTVAQIRQWNGLRDDLIVPGQRLRLEGGGTSSGVGSWRSHVVRRGENLTRIARRYGASVADLMKWNALKDDRLSPGQRLAVFVR